MPSREPHRQDSQVDETTLLATRGHFSRVSIEVDLNKPLISKLCSEEQLEKLNTRVCR